MPLVSFPSGLEPPLTITGGSIMDLNAAIKAHGDWKLKLRGAIQSKEKLDAATISVDNQCPLGKWLHSEAKDKYGKLASYKNCVTKHADFHKCAGNVAKTVNAGKYPEAEAMLGANSEYMNASTAVAIAIGALKKEAGI